MAGDGAKRILGVLGGMGPAATARFYADLVASTEAGHDQDHPHVIVDSDPAIPDRTDFLFGRGPDPRPRLIAAATRLRNLGVGLIVMPCNTASVFIDDLAGIVSLPFVNWVDEAGRSLSLNFEPPVGILATKGTIKAQLYQDALERHGVDYVIPDEEAQSGVMDAIYGEHGLKTTGRSTERARSSLTSAANDLAGLGAKSLVLGCTELPLIMGSDDPSWPVPVADPARSVIKTALAWLQRKGY